MTIIDHGTWVRYTPAEPPKDAPPNTMFARRESDGVDWYDYVNSGRHFQTSSVKLTVMAREPGGPLIVSAPATDATMLFPANHRVIEITGNYSQRSINDLMDEFGTKVIDVKTGKLSDPPPHIFAGKTSQPAPPSIDDLLARIAALEKRLQT
jgi:hypothetical protein